MGVPQKQVEAKLVNDNYGILREFSIKTDRNIIVRRPEMITGKRRIDCVRLLNLHSYVIVEKILREISEYIQRNE